MVRIRPFLTAYDPSDLPGGSIDPLGFERGYLHLADKILPGMTNVAACPRYFGILCAGAHLAETDDDAPPREIARNRREAILRLERLWALANVLAYGEEDGALSELRGVTYARRQAEALSNNGGTRADSDFKFLSRQAPYGVLGIYGAVAESAHLIYRRTYDLTPGLGLPLAESFCTETSMPSGIRRAIRDDADVSLSTLRAWGENAWLWGKSGKQEKRLLSEMLHGEPVRSRFCQVLSRQTVVDGENELQRLQRIASVLKSSDSNLDLWESVEMVIRYEECYQLAMLMIERLLFLCRNRADPSGSLSIADVESDSVVLSVMTALPLTVESLLNHAGQCQTEHFRSGLDRLSDVLQFLELAAASCGSTTELVAAVLSRHTDTQHGKFDRGRRKMPWIQSMDDKLSLTMTRVGGLKTEAVLPEHITPHPYRLHAADNWLRAAGEI